MRSSAGSNASSERCSRSTPERGEPGGNGLALVVHRELAAVIGHLAPAPIRRRRTGEGLPSSRRHLPHVPRPLRQEVLRGCASRLFTPSMAFALTAGARLLLVPTMRWVCSRRGRLRFMLRTAWSLPLKGFRHRAPARPVSRPDRRSATGPPGSYPDRTFTGRRRRACLRTDQIILHRPSTSRRTPSLIEGGRVSDWTPIPQKLPLRWQLWQSVSALDRGTLTRATHLVRAGPPL